MMKEIKIPMRWGHVAGKLWNSTALESTNSLINGKAHVQNHCFSPTLPTKNKVLCIHGWLDNANSFDPIIPTLPKDSTFLAIDLPGHGLSSHLPLGTIYYFADWIFDVSYVLKWMKWDKDANENNKVILMGHSMGAAIALLYASMYPRLVGAVVSLDVLAPYTFRSKDCHQILDQALRMYLNFDHNPEVGSKPYTRRIAMQRLLEFKSLDQKSAAIMLERGMRRSRPKFKNNTDLNNNTAERDVGGEITSDNKVTDVGDKDEDDDTTAYVMNRDMRLHYRAPHYYTDDEWKIFFGKLECPVLAIMGTDSHISREEIIGKDKIRQYSNLLRTILGDKFVLKEFPGTHHLHMNDPQSIAPTITQFLNGDLSS